MSRLRLLPEDYYARCHAAFRRATDQTDVMLAAVDAIGRGRAQLGILSVGSGIGLFELPMLERLQASGIHISSFVGVDRSEHACRLLERRLQEAFGVGLAFEIVPSSIEAFTTQKRFDLILYNHVLEYLGDTALQELEKSLRFLSPGGKILIFSPQRGGINKPYAQVMLACTGAEPLFADDIAALLEANEFSSSKTTLPASLDISPLLGSGRSPEKIELLSFLTQADCRVLPDDALAAFIRHYRSLLDGHPSRISHPTTLFTVSAGRG